MRQIFLSYPRIDGDKAQRLHRDLSSPDVHIWFDRLDLLPGMKWRPAIRKAIRESRYFVALLSKRAVSTRGFRHTELREAWEVMKEFPDDAIFLIPTRLDDCRMPIHGLGEINFADLFPDWDAGVTRLRAALRLKPAPAKGEVKHRRTARERAAAPPPKKAAYHYQVGLVDLDGRIPSMAALAKGLSGVQTLFRFKPSQTQVPHQARKTMNGLPHLDIEQLPESFYKRVSPLSVDYVICLSDRLLKFEDDDTVYSNYLTATSPSRERVLFVSHHGLTRYAAKAGVSIDVALAFMVTAELVDYFVNTGYHRARRNCPMDFTEDHAHLVGGLRAARFCKACAKSLGGNRDIERAVTAMLSWGR